MTTNNTTQVERTNWVERIAEVPGPRCYSGPDADGLVAVYCLTPCARCGKDTVNELRRVKPTKAVWRLLEGTRALDHMPATQDADGVCADCRYWEQKERDRVERHEEFLALATHADEALASVIAANDMVRAARLLLDRAESMLGAADSAMARNDRERHGSARFEALMDVTRDAARGARDLVSRVEGMTDTVIGTFNDARDAEMKVDANREQAMRADRTRQEFASALSAAELAGTLESARPMWRGAYPKEMADAYREAGVAMRKASWEAYKPLHDKLHPQRVAS